MRLQILHHAHEHEHEHARTVSLHPLLYPSHPRITRVRGYARKPYAASPRAHPRPPQACHFSNNRVSHRHDAVFTSVAVVVDEADDANARTRRRARASGRSIASRRARVPYRRPCVRIDSSSVVVVGRGRRGVRSVDARGFRSRLARVSTSKRSRGVGEDRGVKGVCRPRSRRRANRTHTSVAH